MTETQVLTHLHKRYPSGAYAFFNQVRNATGWSGGRTRTADAVALSLWPSRGLDLHGFEVKVSRSDWLHELKQPEKADEGIFGFCDRWWAVVAEDVKIEPGELPVTWGLMIASTKGIKVKVDAPKLEARPVTREFLAAFLRRVEEESVSRHELETMIEERVQGRLDGHTRILHREVEEVKAKLRRVEEFETASGVDVSRGYHLPEKIGMAVRAVLNNEHVFHEKRLRALLPEAERIVDLLKESIDRLSSSDAPPSP